MRYVILSNSVQQGPKFRTQEEAMEYAHELGFTSEDGELKPQYQVVEVSEWKKD